VALRRWVDAFCEAVAPHRCAGCDDVSRVPLCSTCEAAILGRPSPPVRRAERGEVWVAFTFAGPVRTAIHHGKFRGDRRALTHLAGLAAERLLAAHLPPPDAAVAVPLGFRRQRSRGYNQAAVIADVLAERFGVAVLNGMVRLRETRPQAERDEAGRRRNVADAFAWRGADIGGRRLWLVDDVLTTGATSAAAAGALRDAGARRVDIVVLAAVP
jgi:ComF family protein